MGASSEEADAVVALVRIDRLRKGMERNPHAADSLLAPLERAMIRNAATDKRRGEFVAGRLAAKCASATLRQRCGESVLPWRAAIVAREASHGPRCEWPDGIVHCVSIAHSGKFAAALAVCGPAAVGIDLEPSLPAFSSQLQELLHPLERAHVTSPSEARLCWVVREAWGKYTTRGIAVDWDEVATLAVAGARWLKRPAGPGSSAVVAAGANPALCMAVALAGAT